MKTLVLAALCISVILNKEMLRTENNKIDIVGEAYNTDNKPVVAVSYGVASNGGYSLKDDAGYVKPEMVLKIADVVKPPMPGPLEAVSEVSQLLLYNISLCISTQYLIDVSPFFIFF